MNKTGPTGMTLKELNESISPMGRVLTLLHNPKQHSRLGSSTTAFLHLYVLVTMDAKPTP
jgi:hypothetical protein